jgi:hypothetical protein
MRCSSTRALSAIAIASLLAACGGGGGGGAAGQPPVVPSGIIAVTPKSSAKHPLVFHCPGGVCPTQTFLVSERGYGGSFTFGGTTSGDPNCHSFQTCPFQAPPGSSLTLTGYAHQIGLLCACESWKVDVSDSLGNTAEIFAGSSYR